MLNPKISKPERSLIHVKVAREALLSAIQEGQREYEDVCIALLWIQEDLEKRLAQQSKGDAQE